jgi:bacillithiol biosynthesis deacetylase BshB1
MKLDVLAIGTHPDDVEICCGGTVALLVDQGHKVGILHLTRGERGTRGTVEEREVEARAAAAALGAVEMAFLDCGDGAFRHGEAQEDALIEVLRAWRPEILLGPPAADRHPDHGRAHRLVADAAFYAGLARRGTANKPHRPGAVFSYMQNDPFDPAFIIDVTRAWEKKMAALAAYDSQLYRPQSGPPGGGQARKRGEPMTKVSSPEYWLTIEGRARHFGQMIGAAYGEPFWSRLPLSIRDVMLLLPGGLR